MSTPINSEEIEATRSERLLAVLLAVFLLVGIGWTYYKIPSWVESAVPNEADYSMVERAEEKSSAAWETSLRLEEATDQARTDFDVSRAEYNLALTKGDDTAEAKTEYEDSKIKYENTRKEWKTATAEAGKADKAAQDARNEYEKDSRGGLRGWVTALLLFGLVLVTTVGSYVLIGRLRERGSRYLPLGFAGAGVGAVMALVFAVDYITDYIDPLDLGPIVLSVLGIVATIVAFRVLQKYLAARVPIQRVRKGECPFCGFQLHDSGLDTGHHCSGCGREVIANCATCAKPRRVGSRYCADCGSA